VLYALREKIGTADFRRLERAWVTRYRDGVASTGDFIRLASEITGKDMSGFLTPWLFDTKTPPMPGHPKWHSR
jgi:aminopeptidase N